MSLGSGRNVLSESLARSQQTLDSQERPRLDGLDALRGIAALAVVLFHFTTRFDQLFGHSAPPWLSFPLGHYGVNLFFIISGFVIFMTIERSKAPMDFVVSRFSRLYPAYWVAIALTFTITHWLGLPGHLADLKTALLNGLMFHGMLFRVPHVDGVYWTLEVELLFYLGMLVLMVTSQLKHVHRVLFFLLGVRLTYYVAQHVLDVSLPWVIYRFLIIGQIAWFTLGMAIYRLTFHAGDQYAKLDAPLAIVAIVIIAITDSLAIAGMALAFGYLVWSAANGRLKVLTTPILVWLGSISYTLYLLHENIGWSIILTLREAGVGVDLSILAALGSSLALATAVTRWVERPAMAAIRNYYKRRKSCAAG